MQLQTKKELQLNHTGGSNSIGGGNSQMDLLKTGSVKGLSQLFAGGMGASGKQASKSNLKGHLGLDLGGLQLGGLQNIDEGDSSLKHR